MRALNEQWVENGRMYKAVETINKTCEGCRYNDDMGKCACKYFIECCQGDDYIVHDLGPVNEDGVLACPFCGAFPEVIQPEDGLAGYGCHCPKCKRAISGIHGDMQGVRDAWNRRA